MSDELQAEMAKFLERTKCHSLVMPGWPSDSCKPFRLLGRPATEQTRDKASAATFSFPDLCLLRMQTYPVQLAKLESLNS